MQIQIRLPRLILPILLILPFLWPVVPAAAQEGTGSITGAVVDATTGLPLGSVQVVARPAADSTQLIAGRMSDATGRFSVTGLGSGQYRLEFRLLGYSPSTQVVTIGTGAALTQPVALGSVELSPVAVMIEALEVTAVPDAVVYAPDRDIYSVDALPAASGGSAADALGQVPDLEMDINGTVTMRGNTPRIYINGRPAPMRGESLEVFLRQFPAENIQSIEVMPNPSSRYEAEGAGGIVNIVLKRGVRLGLTGNVFANAGSRGDIGTGARATYQAGDLTLQGGTSARLNRTETSTSERRQNLLADPITLLDQESISDRAGESANVDFQVEYSITPRSRITAQTRVNGNLSDADRTTHYTEMDFNESVTDRYDRIAADDSRGLSTDLSLEFRHDIEERGHDITVELEYQRGRDMQESLVRQRLIDEIIDADPTIELTLDDTREHQNDLGMRIDYTRPLGGRGQFEIGYRGQWGDNLDGRLRQVGPEGGPEDQQSIIDTGFTQKETVHSGYLTGTQRFGKFNAQVGVRAERTDSRYDMPAQGVTFGNDYLGFFPNANLTYQFSRATRMRASYSVRVRRPGANILNPVDRSTDPLNRRVGNPDIDPQYTHSFSLDASWNAGPATFRVAPFYQRSVDEFTQYKTVDALGISTTTWENLSSSASYGTSLSMSIRNFHGFGGSVNLNGRREERDGSFIRDAARRSSTRWSIRTNLDARVSETLNFQSSVTYNPPRQLTQGSSSATVMTSTALRQRLLDGRASLSLNITDPLDIYRPSTRTSDPAFVELGRDRVSIRRASLNLSYNFGGRGRGGARGGASRPQQAPVRPAPVPAPAPVGVGQ